MFKENNGAIGPNDIDTGKPNEGETTISAPISGIEYFKIDQGGIEGSRLPDDLTNIFRDYVEALRGTDSLKKKEVHQLVAERLNKLRTDLDDEVVMTVLFQLFALSSASPEQWQSFPLDTPGGEISEFIKGELAELLRNKES